jgi:YqjK-like protein
MNKRLAYLAARRLELVQQIEDQRMDIAEISSRWQKPFAVADTGLKALHLVYRHPALIAGGVTALLAWRRKGVAGLAKNGWRLLYLYPSAIFFGLKYLASVSHFSKAERD